MSFKRLFPTIEGFIERHQSVMILGPRGTGKSFYINSQLINRPEFLQISLLETDLFSRYTATPSLISDELKSFSNKHTRFGLLIDEIQLVPALTHEVHRAMEIYGDRLCCVLTGSSARKLKRQNADLLAGRAIYFDFFPLNPEELGSKFSLAQVLRFGTLPKVWNTDDTELMRRYLQTYVATYLREEIQREAQIRNLSGFARFLEIAAASIGQPISYQKLARTVGTSGPTIKNYFQICIDTLIGFELPIWDRSIRQQLSASSKYYLFDCGVVNAINQTLTSEVRPHSYNYGLLYENLVVNLVRQKLLRAGTEAKMYYLRTQRGMEIDLVLQRNSFSTPVFIEIKSHTAPQLVDVEAPFTAIQNEFADARFLVICSTPHAYEQGKVTFLPTLEGIELACELIAAT